MVAAAGDRNVWVVGGGDLAGQFADVGSRRVSRGGAWARPSVVAVLYFLAAPIDQGAEVRTAFMSIAKGFSTYSEGMTLVATNAELGDLGACRRR
jgi:hypothetical protein